MFDLLIKNGCIVDGSGEKQYKADLAVQDGLIRAIAPAIDPGLNRQLIDAAGCAVSPGFIDIHSHSDFTFLSNPQADSKIRQGVTTEVVGHCGFTAAPVSAVHFDELMQYLVNTVAVSEQEKQRWRWPNQCSYLNEVAGGKTVVNLASLVGHGTIRVAVMGFACRKPAEHELWEMGRLLEEELKEGLWGLSTGLQYDPGSFAETDELIYLGRITARYGGLYTTHLKSEGRDLLKCLAEAAEIGKQAGVSVLISHLKASHPPNWGKAAEALELIDNARAAGVEIDFDVYPYTAYGSGLIDLVPPWVREQGTRKMSEILSDRRNYRRILAEMEKECADWENPMTGAEWETVRIASMKTEKNKIYEGKNLAQVGEAMGCSPAEAVLNLLLAESGAVKIIFFAMCEQDLEKIMRHPRAIFCSDGRAVSPHGVLGRSKIHPRYYGTFPRILGRYARERQIISLEEAVKKMTSLPARKMGVIRRGLIREGNYADLTVFNSREVLDLATFEHPHRYPEGIKYVIVNGVVAVTPDGYNGALPGRILQRHC